MAELDTLTKWLLGLLASSIVGLLIFLAKFVFSGSTARLETLSAKQGLVDTQLATGQQQFQHIRENQQRTDERVSKLDERLARVERQTFRGRDGE